jgi:hypothetical protein
MRGEAAAAPRRPGPDLAERHAPPGPTAYRSSMCSITGDAAEGETSADALDRLGAAIDALAARAAGDEDITERLAAVWGMLAALDPELARRLAGY